MKERTVAGMRCSEVLAVLSDFVDGELEPAVSSRVEEHLLGCPDCDRFGRNFGSMVVALRRESEKSPEVQLEVMTRLLERVRKERAE